MYSYLLIVHGNWWWVVVALMVIAMLKMLVGWIANQSWTAIDRYLISGTVWAVRFQFVIGLVMYILYYFQGREDWVTYGLAHVLPALLGIAGVEFAGSRIRPEKTPVDRRKFMFAFIGMTVGLFLMYGAISYALSRYA